MPEFLYEAQDVDGVPQRGQITAADADAAIRLLEERGWRVDLVGEVEPSPQLSTREAVEVGQHLAELTDAGLPLASGLRALADEVPQRRMRITLHNLARELSSGRSLPEVLADSNAPAELRALVRVGLRSGGTGEALSHYVRHARQSSELRRRAALSLCYAGVLILISLTVLIGVLVYLVPQFRRIFEDFGTELPGMTSALIQVSDGLRYYWPFIVGGLVVLMGLGWLAVNSWFSKADRRRLLWRVPFIGPLVKQAALTRFARLLGLLVERQLPLPEALRLAGAACADAAMAHSSDQLAARIDQGQPLTRETLAGLELPLMLSEVLVSARESQALPAALSALAEVSENRADYRATIVAPLIEPLVIAGTALAVLVIVVALFMPLIKLLNDLS